MADKFKRTWNRTDFQLPFPFVVLDYSYLSGWELGTGTALVVRRLFCWCTMNSQVSEF